MILGLMAISVSGASTTVEHYWSKSASTVPQESNSYFSLSAPNKEFVAQVHQYQLTVTYRGRILPGIPDEGIAPVSEMKWSPDSKAIFVNWDNGGAVGTWEVNTYLVNNYAVKRVNVIQNVKKDFVKHYKCTSTAEPNIAAIKWIESFRKLLFVAQVPPDSNCSKMGMMMGYVVSVPSGEIVRIYNQHDLINKWNSQIVKPH